MASHGTTGAELADVLGIGDQAIMRRLTAATPFTATELVKVARHFSVPVGDLFPCDERVSA
jgi:transcriptional regulator with XRE-family HTH domain